MGRETLNRLLGVNAPGDVKPVRRRLTGRRDRKAVVDDGRDVRPVSARMAIANNPELQEVAQQAVEAANKESARPKYSADEQMARATRGADSLNQVVQGVVPHVKDTPSQSAGTGDQRRWRDLDDIANYIEQTYPVESDEDKAKREKREKSQRVMAAVGDAFSAFSEAYNNARGRTVTPTKGASRQLEDRLLALEKVRQSDAKSRIAALERLAQLRSQQESKDKTLENEAMRNENQSRNITRLEAKDAADAAEREWRHQLALDKFEYQKEKDKLNIQLREKQISIQEYNAKTSRLNSIEQERHHKEQEANARGKKADPMGGQSSGGKKHKQNPYG